MFGLFYEQEDVSDLDNMMTKIHMNVLGILPNMHMKHVKMTRVNL